MLKGKFEKLIDVQVLLRLCLFIDVLSAAKKFSLVTQNSDIDIIFIVDSIESAKQNYEIGNLKQMQKTCLLCQHWSLSLMLSKVTKRESHHTKGRNWNITQERNSIWETTEFTWCDPFCCVMKRGIVMFIPKQEIIMPLAMVTKFCLMFAKSWIQLFGHRWQKMKVRMIKSYQSNLLRSTIFLKDSRPCLFLNPSLAIPYKLASLMLFNTPTVILTLKTLSPCHWSKICTLGKDRKSWHGIKILIELCLCTPFSNATFERFFSHLKVAKMELESRL